MGEADESDTALVLLLAPGTLLGLALRAPAAPDAQPVGSSHSSHSRPTWRHLFGVREEGGVQVVRGAAQPPPQRAHRLGALRLQRGTQL